MEASPAIEISEIDRTDVTSERDYEAAPHTNSEPQSSVFAYSNPLYESIPTDDEATDSMNVLSADSEASKSPLTCARNVNVMSLSI